MLFKYWRNILSKLNNSFPKQEKIDKRVNYIFFFWLIYILEIVKIRIQIYNICWLQLSWRNEQLFARRTTHKCAHQGEQDNDDQPSFENMGGFCFYIVKLLRFINRLYNNIKPVSFMDWGDRQPAVSTNLNFNMNINEKKYIGELYPIHNVTYF